MAAPAGTEPCMLIVRGISVGKTDQTESRTDKKSSVLPLLLDRMAEGDSVDEPKG